MALLTRMSTHFTTLLRQTSTRTFVAGLQASGDDFKRPVDAFVADALKVAGLREAGEVEALKVNDVANMGLLKSCNLDDPALGFSVGAKAAITRAVVFDIHLEKATDVRANIKLQREKSLTGDKKMRSL